MGWHWRHLHWLWLSVLVFVLDQWTKAWIINSLWLGERVNIIPGLFDLLHTVNPGAAFSLLANAGGWQVPLLTAVAFGVSAVLMVWLVRQPRGARLIPLSFSLVIAGALGNGIDRIQHGHVIDFILVYWQQWFFPAFNVADIAISCGAILLLVEAFWPKRQPIESKR